MATDISACSVVCGKGERRRVRAGEGGGAEQRQGGRGGGERAVEVVLSRKEGAVQRFRGNSPEPWRRVVQRPVRSRISKAQRVSTIWGD